MASQMDRIEDKIDRLFDEVTILKVAIARHDASDASVVSRLSAIESDLKPLKKTNTITTAVFKAVPLVSAACGVVYTVIRIYGGN